MATDGLEQADHSTVLALKHMWKTALELDEIDEHTSFLDLGGDSLAAMLCIAKVRIQFGVDLPLDELFADDASLSRVAGLIHEERKRMDS